MQIASLPTLMLLAADAIISFRTFSLSTSNWSSNIFPEEQLSLLMAVARQLCAVLRRTTAVRHPAQDSYIALLQLYVILVETRESRTCLAILWSSCADACQTTRCPSAIRWGTYPVTTIHGSLDECGRSGTHVYGIPPCYCGPAADKERYREQQTSQRAACNDQGRRNAPEAAHLLHEHVLHLRELRHDTLEVGPA